MRPVSGGDGADTFAVHESSASGTMRIEDFDADEGDVVIVYQEGSWGGTTQELIDDGNGGKELRIVHHNYVLLFSGISALFEHGMSVGVLRPSEKSSGWNDAISGHTGRGGAVVTTP